MQSVETGIAIAGMSIISTEKLNIHRDHNNAAEWLEFGIALCRLHEATPWMIGDWFNFGLRKSVTGDVEYGQKVEAARAAVDVIGRNMNTIRRYADVCASTPVALRSASLQFSHYKELAGMDSEVQKSYVDACEKEKWTVADLRQAIAENDEGNPRDKSAPIKTLMGWAMTGLRMLRQQDVTKLPPSERAKVKQDLEPIVEIYNSL